MVKENREKRQREEEKRKTATQMRKEARLRAQQMINKVRGQETKSLQVLDLLLIE